MKTPLRILLSALVAAVLLKLLFAWGGVSREDFARALKELTLAEWLLALTLHAGIYLARAARFRILVPGARQVPFRGVLAASASHNLAAYVLPAKTGEAALVVYLRAHCGIPATAGLASLLVSRLLDLATLAGAMALACLVIALAPGREPPAWVGPGAVLLLALALGFVVLGARARALADLGIWGVRALGLAGTALGQRATDLARRVAEALESAGRGRRYRWAAGLSLLVWLGVFLFYAVLARATGLERVGLAEATFGSSLAVASNLLPVNAFAAFGTQEAGWALGFGFLGVDRDAALATGVAVHLVQLLDVVLLGLAGHLAMGLRSSRLASASPPPPGPEGRG